MKWKTDIKKEFNKNIISFTDSICPRGLPFFETKVDGNKLLNEVRDFWQELNDASYVDVSKVSNLTSAQVI